MDLTRAKKLAPIRMLWRDGRAMADLCLVGDVRFTAPFFDEQVSALLVKPLSRLARFEVSLDELAASVERDPPVPLRGLVFHLSRCGSTLLSQQLAALPRHVVLSEPSVLDGALEPRRQSSDDERIGWVRAIVGALTRRRHDETAAFVKLAPTAILHAELLRRAFPGVPHLFVFREPLAVMASNLDEPGPLMMPGAIDPARLGLRDPFSMSHEEYLARLLARLCDAAIEQGMPLLDYDDLPRRGIDTLASAFDLDLSADDRARMEAVTTRDAKAPHQAFVPKQRAVTEACRAATERWLRGAFEQLRARA